MNSTLAALRHVAHQYWVLLLRRRKWLATELDSSTASQLAEPGPKRRIFVLLSADYGNLGDVAIRMAQVELLGRMFPDCLVVDVPQSQTLTFIRHARHRLARGDVITMVGGGAMGDIYHDAEYLHRVVVRSFGNQKVIIFPSSPLFQDTLFGRWWLLLSRRTYARHGDVTILLRDRASFMRATEYFPGASIILAPDVVLTLQELPTSTDRSGVVASLRSDVESNMSAEVRAAFIMALRSEFAITESDTDIDRASLPNPQGRDRLRNLLSTYGAAEAVVTDRLHGTIFALLMKTPCIVFDNSYGKIHEFLSTWGLEGPGVRILAVEQRAQVATIIDELRRTKPATPDTAAAGDSLEQVLRNYFDT